MRSTPWHGERQRPRLYGDDGGMPACVPGRHRRRSVEGASRRRRCAMRSRAHPSAWLPSGRLRQAGRRAAFAKRGCPTPFASVSPNPLAGAFLVPASRPATSRERQLFSPRQGEPYRRRGLERKKGLGQARSQRPTRPQHVRPPDKAVKPCWGRPRRQSARGAAGAASFRAALILAAAAIVIGGGASTLAGIGRNARRAGAVARTAIRSVGARRQWHRRCREPE